MNIVDVDRKADAQVTQSDLLAIPEGPRTEATLRTNCTVGVQYLEAWLGGMGCVPLDNLMEDAATAEICRTQVLTLTYVSEVERGRIQCYGRSSDLRPGLRHGLHASGHHGGCRHGRDLPHPGAENLVSDFAGGESVIRGAEICTDVAAAL